MNKSFLTVAWVFSIISIVSSSIAILVSLLFVAITNSAGSYYGAPANELAILNSIAWGYVLFTIGLLVLSIISTIQFAKGKNGQASKSAMIGWSIFLLFTSLIGGIFGLIGALSEDNGTDKRFTDNSIEGRIKEIDVLFESGLISKDEYNQRRKNILDSI